MNQIIEGKRGQPVAASLSKTERKKERNGLQLYILALILAFG